MKSLGIVGCGWLGTKLAARLSEEFEVYVTTKSREKAIQLESLGYEPTVVEFPEENEGTLAQWEALSDLKAVVLLVPFSLRRSTQEALTSKMINLISFLGDYGGQLFFASSTGVYPKEANTYAEKDLDTEQVMTERQMKQAFPQVNVLRLAGLMGGDRLLSNYNVKNLQDPVNHVHYEDVCSVIMKMIDEKVHGALFNVAAPLHPSKEDVIRAQLTHVTATVSDPAGRVISSEKLMTELGFTFSHSDPRLFHKR